MQQAQYVVHLQLTDVEQSLILRACNPHRFSIHNIILREPRQKQSWGVGKKEQQEHEIVH